MTTPIDNDHTGGNHHSRLPTAGQLRAAHPLSPSHRDTVERGRHQVSAIIDGTDDRLLVVAGPCSVHDPEATAEYAARLASIAARCRQDLCVVMRLFFEKPRTTVGWKGLVSDPGMDASFRVDEGLTMARGLLRDVLDLGVPVGTEFLDPIISTYLADAVSWGAIGARTAQSQIHRQLASGLAMPVGFKNPPDGDPQGAIDAVLAAAAPHVFPGIDQDGRVAMVSTPGNPSGHLVLRGGAGGPNYDHLSVETALEGLVRSGLAPRVVVDASHGNSGKDHRRQPVVVADIGQRLETGDRAVRGVMVESFLVAGRQDLRLGHTDGLRYGQSVTDACLGWDETESVLLGLAESVSRRRQLVGAGLP